MNKKCLTCKNEFYVSPSRKHIKNCSYECNKIWRKIESDNLRNTFKECQCGCGTLIPIMDKFTHRRKYVFGHQPIPKVHPGRFKKGHKGMQQEENPNWRGGFVMRNGYKARRIKGRKIYLHRYIMEKKLGRRLKQTEHVHHIDHDKLNNDPSNLIILSPSEHAKYHSDVMWNNILRKEAHSWLTQAGR